MSQYMMCKSNYDLSKYGRKLLGKSESNKVFLSVLNEYYPKERDNNIWIIDNIDVFCNEVINEDMFFSSEVYCLLNRIYDLCEWIILWYGGEYNDLDVIYTKDELMKYVQHCIEKPCCELYVRLCKDVQ